MLRKRLLSIAISIVSVAGQLSAADATDDPAETYELRYRFIEGQELHYRITDEREYDYHVGPDSSTVRDSTTTLRKHHVQEVGDDGRARIELTLVRVQMTAEIGEQTARFDSAVDSIPPAMFQGVAGTIGRPLSVATVTPRGEVVDTELLIEGQSGSGFDSAQHDLLPLLPESPVAIGDVWQLPFEVEVLVDPQQQQNEPDRRLKKRIKLERVYSLEAVEDGQATIAVRTVVLTPIRDAFLQGQLIQMTTHGTARLDLESGLLVDYSVTLDNTVVGFSGSPQSSLSVVVSRRESLVPPTEVAAEASEAETR